MKDPSAKKERMEDIPLDIKAEMALREAVADAIAEHKLRGHPIVVWREGKVVTVPPEEIGKGISGVRRRKPVAKKTGT
ncbi:MAG: hypothetical protein ABSB94_20920 [Syntrophorhabdales bacterium]|jgi:hypothetical protein